MSIANAVFRDIPKYPPHFQDSKCSFSIQIGHYLVKISTGEDDIAEVRVQRVMSGGGYPGAMQNWNGFVLKLSYCS